MVSVLKQLIFRLTQSRQKIKTSSNNKFGFLTELYNSTFEEFCEVGNFSVVRNSYFGRYTYTNISCIINNTDIGKFSCIGPNVTINPAQHDYKFLTTHRFLYNKEYKIFNKPVYNKYNKKTIIGNDVWVGVGAIIMGGVKIGDGSVIGSGAVVTKDVDPYTIVIGVPAKPLKKRFTEDQIKKVINLKWWDWKFEKIMQNKHLFEKDLSNINF